MRLFQPQSWKKVLLYMDNIHLQLCMGHYCSVFRVVRLLLMQQRDTTWYVETTNVFYSIEYLLPSFLRLRRNRVGKARLDNAVVSVIQHNFKSSSV